MYYEFMYVYVVYCNVFIVCRRQEDERPLLWKLTGTWIKEWRNKKTPSPCCQPSRKNIHTTQCFCFFPRTPVLLKNAGPAECNATWEIAAWRRCCCTHSGIPPGSTAKDSGSERTTQTRCCPGSGRLEDVDGQKQKKTKTNKKREFPLCWSGLG